MSGRDDQALGHDCPATDLLAVLVDSHVPRHLRHVRCFAYKLKERLKRNTVEETNELTSNDQRGGMPGDFAANGFAFEGFMAPISSGITSELGGRCRGRHLVAKVTFYCGLSAW